MEAQIYDEELLSQRQLRNESSRVLRGVEAGRSFIITNRSRPVARLVPITSRAPELPITRPARRRGGWKVPSASRGSGPIGAILDELREDRL